jgi:putative flippase GtrA
MNLRRLIVFVGSFAACSAFGVYLLHAQPGSFWFGVLAAVAGGVTAGLITYALERRWPTGSRR